MPKLCFAYDLSTRINNPVTCISDNAQGACRVNYAKPCLFSETAAEDLSAENSIPKQGPDHESRILAEAVWTTSSSCACSYLA